MEDKKKKSPTLGSDENTPDPQSNASSNKPESLNNGSPYMVSFGVAQHPLLSGNVSWSIRTRPGLTLHFFLPIEDL